MNRFYNGSASPTAFTRARALTVRDQWTAIASGFDLLSSVLNFAGVQAIERASDRTVDATSAVQAACDAGGTWAVPYGDGLRVTGTVNITRPVRFVGGGANPYTAINEGAANATGKGSFFYLDHGNIGFNIIPSGGSSGAMSMVEFIDCGTYRNQPIPGAGSFTPYDHAYDIKSVRTDLRFRNFCALNPTRFLDFAGIRGGNLRLRNVIGQPLKMGISIDQAYHTCELDVDFWNYWSLNAGVLAYQQANRQALSTGRIDGLDLHFFSINDAIGWVVQDGGYGAVQLASGPLAYFDVARVGVSIVPSVTPTSKAVINLAQLQISGVAADAAASQNIVCAGSGVTFAAGNAQLVTPRTAALQIAGTGNRFDLGVGRFDRWGYDSTLTPAVVVATGNQLRFGSEPIIINEGGRPFSGGGGTILKPAMVSV